MFPEWTKPQALARRTAIGLGRDGSFSGGRYGDIFIFIIAISVVAQFEIHRTVE
jgi:hypothetical protein